MFDSQKRLVIGFLFALGSFTLSLLETSHYYNRIYAESGLRDLNVQDRNLSDDALKFKDATRHLNLWLVVALLAFVIGAYILAKIIERAVLLRRERIQHGFEVIQ